MDSEISTLVMHRTVPSMIHVIVFKHLLDKSMVNYQSGLHQL